MESATPDTAATATAMTTTMTTTPLQITILLQSGARSAFAVDAEYLRRHGVAGVEAPGEMTVWQLKECVWKDWKEGTVLRFGGG